MPIAQSREVAVQRMQRASKRIILVYLPSLMRFFPRASKLKPRTPSDLSCCFKATILSNKPVHIATMSTSTSEKQARNEALLHDQTNLLPRKQLLIVFATMASAFLVAYADQNGIAVALPTMAKDLNAADTIAWAGTSSMIANTVFQVLYGRLSDIFGRKVIYLSAVALLAVGDILCATAVNATMLYSARGLAGVATG